MSQCLFPLGRGITLTLSAGHATFRVDGQMGFQPLALTPHEFEDLMRAFPNIEDAATTQLQQVENRSETWDWSWMDREFELGPDLKAIVGWTSLCLRRMTPFGQRSEVTLEYDQLLSLGSIMPELHELLLLQVNRIEELARKAEINRVARELIDGPAPKLKIQPLEERCRFHFGGTVGWGC
jgi:hypothetical protein